MGLICASCTYFLWMPLSEGGFREFNTGSTRRQQRSIFLSKRFSVNGGENRDKDEQEMENNYLEKLFWAVIAYVLKGFDRWRKKRSVSYLTKSAICRKSKMARLIVGISRRNKKYNGIISYILLKFGPNIRFSTFYKLYLNYILDIFSLVQMIKPNLDSFLNDEICF